MKKPRGLFRRLMKICMTLVLLGLVFYLGVVAMVCWKEANVPQAVNYDAIIVLGAQVKPTGEPSVQLQWRLDAAAKAWKDTPCPIVTCGAKGRDEPAPEALVMREELIRQGVTADMILTDAESFNTRQNIRHAAELLEGSGVKRVAIVTSDYHLPRAMALAKDMGLEATGIPSPTKQGMRYWLKNHGREALAWIKYWGQKYLRLPLE